MTLHYWSLCDKKSYNGHHHSLTVSPAKVQRMTSAISDQSVSVRVTQPRSRSTLGPLEPSVLVLTGARCPQQPPLTVVTITIMLQLRWLRGKKKGIISSVEDLHHPVSQSAQDEIENERYYFAHLLVF